MFFKDIVGQEEIIQHLVEAVSEGRIPHAQLFAGPAGVGKLAVAVAYAQYLVCSGRSDAAGLFEAKEATRDACGHCPSCAKMTKLVHPDVHFMVPVYKRESGRDNKSYPQTDDFISDWREAFLENPYLSLNQWLRAARADKQQGEIYVAQAGEIIRKLSLRSSEGGYRVVIVWLPEKMNEECANKLLKLIEEPPAETVFLLVSDEPEKILPTIQSRCQRINFQPIDETALQHALVRQFSLDPSEAAQVAHIAGGSWAKACETLRIDDVARQYMELFIQLMRMAYARNLQEMRRWSEELAAMGRATQKQFLEYCQRMIRESFMANFHISDISYMNAAETNFTSRFSPFVNERNIFGITAVLADAARDVECNVNPKMIFFDLALKMIMLLKQR